MALYFLVQSPFVMQPTDYDYFCHDDDDHDDKTIYFIMQAF